MKPQFTTPCFIRKNTPELRAKLEDIGYIKMLVWTRETDTCLKTSPMLEVVGTNDYAPQYYTFSSLQSKPDSLIDCGTNIPLFLDLAAMRSDTYANQLMMCESRYTDPKLDYSIVEPGTIIRFGDFDEYAKAFYHRATAQEIIEWHKQKGEQHETHRNNLKSKK